MQIRKIRGLKKSGTLVLVAMLAVLPVGTTAFAGSQLYVSEEGIGIDVQSPRAGKIQTLEVIEGAPVKVAGGDLWATWKNGRTFRANYMHASKTHRCTARNADNQLKRSRWEDGGTLAQSGYVRQTLVGNKVFAKTK
ncbi:MAG: hypothetical protein HFH55_03070 [Lachnospiraceae bacterium]|nr:hypothetical protein [Lachnospiraceae bacterium]